MINCESVWSLGFLHYVDISAKRTKDMAMHEGRSQQLSSLTQYSSCTLIIEFLIYPTWIKFYINNKEYDTVQVCRLALWPSNLWNVGKSFNLWFTAYNREALWISSEELQSETVYIEYKYISTRYEEENEGNPVLENLLKNFRTLWLWSVVEVQFTLLCSSLWPYEYDISFISVINELFMETNEYFPG